EYCLLQQTLAVDDGSGKKKTVSQLVSDGAKQFDVKDLKLTDFCLVNVGEGVQVEQTDFAAEVAAMAE
ncbi:MAG: hypothetical protein MHM6MM_008594, partial [Cercozoa sp. M6MM]